MIEIKDKINARRIAFDYAYRFYVENNHSFSREKVYDLANSFYEYITKDIDLPDIYNEKKCLFLTEKESNDKQNTLSLQIDSYKFIRNETY